MQFHGKVLYVMAGGPNDMQTLRQLVGLAEERRFELTLFDVVESLDRSGRMAIVFASLDDLKKRAIKKRTAELEALIDMIDTHSCELKARVSFGDRREEILRQAAAGRYDLVIKSPGGAWSDRRLADKCPCPVWVLEPGDYTDGGRIDLANAPRFPAAQVTPV